MRWSLNPLAPDITNEKVVFIQALEMQSQPNSFTQTYFGASYDYDLFLYDKRIIIQSRPVTRGARIRLTPLRFPNTINYYMIFLIEKPDPYYTLYLGTDIHLKFSDEVAYEELMQSKDVFGVFIHA
jgi:hypothetical protein